MQESHVQKVRGSVLGASLLIAGCCIGAGMLGVPVLTSVAGFTPSLLMFALSWLFMASTGLLLLEINVFLGGHSGIVSMAEKTLGSVGKAMSWVLFLFLFYSLMGAYVLGSGNILSEFSLEVLGLHIAPWLGSLGFVVVFGLLIFSGTTQVDYFNRALMVGLVAAYIGLVVMGGSHVESDNLAHVDWNAALFVVPPMIISFGFHNLVPSVSYYLGTHKVKRLVVSVLVGSAIPLVIYLLWQWLILGIVPLEGAGGFREALDSGDMATQALRRSVGTAWIVTIAEYFAFFAIVTSLLSVALSFVDFLADGLHVRRTIKGRALLCTLTLLPPFGIAVGYPTIFLKALGYAGAYGAVILFGIIPALMVWVGRYRRDWDMKRLLPGGRPILILVIAFASAIVLLQLARDLGLAGG